MGKNTKKRERTLLRKLLKNKNTLTFLLPNISKGLVWHSFSMTVNHLKRLPVAASKETMEPVSLPTLG